MDRQDYRKMIDDIDKQLVKLFVERMSVSAKIADYKKEHDLPVHDAQREREKLASITEMCPQELRDYTSLLYAMLFELSKSYQSRLIGPHTAYISDALDMPLKSKESSADDGISEEQQVFPASNGICLVVNLSNEPGSLWKFLVRLYAIGLSPAGIEGHSLSNGSSGAVFHITWDIPAGSPDLERLLSELPEICESFTYPGSCSEVE